MTATAPTATAPADETYHIELKPCADPLHRHHGITRDPIQRLRRLLKVAGRDLGFRVSWGRPAPPAELVEMLEQGGTVIRFTDGPAAGRTLMLRRGPLYLRVTFDVNRLKWDALDQVTDTPNAPEAVFVYRRVGEPSAAFIDWTEHGKRRGGCFAVASYAVVAEQPADDVMRDTEKWQAWCWAQVGKAPPSPAKAG